MDGNSYRFLEKLDDLRELLSSVQTIALVGLSPDPDRDSHTIGAYLQSSGYRIVGVNPKAKAILGEPCYPSLREIPEELRGQIDLVTVFRKPAAVPPIIQEAAELGLRTIWLQIGVSSPAALEVASRLGLTVVANRCIRVIHGLTHAKMRPVREP